METDLYLLTRYHRHGDAEAFRNLVESHAGMVHSTASRVTRDAMLAQDVAQETFLALARSSGSAIQSVGAWLHHVAWQKARDVVRGESRRRNNEAAAARELHEPQAEATWAEMEPVLDEAMEELPPQLRSMLIARYFAGRTQREIAKQHQINQSSVSRALEQGIAELRSKLKARGVLCGVGLATLLTAHGVQAAPPALMSTLGKLALTGVGSATASLTLTQAIIATLMTPAAKVTLTAAAVLVATVLANDLASSNSTVRGLFTTNTQTRATASTSGTNTRKTPALPIPISTADVPATSAPVATATVKGPSPAILAQISSLTKPEDFDAFVLKLFVTKDPRHVAAELKRLLGITLAEQMLSDRFTHPILLENAIVKAMADQHPVEMLAWLAMFEGETQRMSVATYTRLLRDHPDITAESIAGILPEGPNREHVLGLLRAQRDPVAEANRIVTTTNEPKTLGRYLWELAHVWPMAKSGDAVPWAMAHLSGNDLNGFIPEFAKQLSYKAPDEAISLLSQITDPKLLAVSFSESAEGLIIESRRVTDVVPFIDKLQGHERAWAIRSLSRTLVQVDQEALMNWINQLESPADFEAALPMSLPQLSDENYTKAITTLMTQLDGQLDVALINTAMPRMPQTTRTSTDIIRRFTALPQYREIGSGQSGNQALLWAAVKQNAEGWVTAQGADPREGAKWIDSLSFKTPADKAFIVGKFAKQWALSNPTAAAQWASGAGVTMR